MPSDPVLQSEERMKPPGPKGPGGFGDGKEMLKAAVVAQNVCGRRVLCSSKK
jgi:hypothetical protein